MVGFYVSSQELGTFSKQRKAPDTFIAIGKRNMIKIYRNKFMGYIKYLDTWDIVLK